MTKKHLDFDEAEALLRVYSDNQLDEIIDELGISTTENPEDESRIDMLLMIGLADEKEVTDALNRLNLIKKKH